MTPTRRRFLRGVGAGIAASLVGVPASAQSTERVFVHPASGLIGDLLGVIEDVGGRTIFEFDNFDFVVAEIPTDRRDELLDDLRVAFIEDDHDIGIPSDWTPSILDLLDPGDNSDCSTHPDQRGSWGWGRIGADGVELDGSGVDVGILDTGIQTDHCSVAVAGGRDFTGTVPSDDYEDRHGHGTHVAGVAGALDNEVGVVGVAPAADLYAVKVLDDEGAGRYSGLVAGIDWCMSNDVELISMSLGGEAESDSVDEAIETATEAGHLLLCAAGNEENDGDSCDDETMTYPAFHPDVVAVSAMNEDDTLASYSSVGEAIDHLAPGTDVRSTFVDNEYARASGTSMACPFVTGVAALVWQQRGEDGPGPNEPVREILADTAETVLDTCQEGHGLVDAPAAVGDERAREGDNSETPPTDDGERDGDTRDDELGAEEDPVSLLGWFIDFIRAIFEFIANLFR